MPPFVYTLCSAYPQRTSDTNPLEYVFVAFTGLHEARMWTVSVLSGQLAEVACVGPFSHYVRSVLAPYADVHNAAEYAAIAFADAGPSDRLLACTKDVAEGARSALMHHCTGQPASVWRSRGANNEVLHLYPYASPPVLLLSSHSVDLADVAYNWGTPYHTSGLGPAFPLLVSPDFTPLVACPGSHVFLPATPTATGICFHAEITAASQAALDAVRPSLEYACLGTLYGLSALVYTTKLTNGVLKALQEAKRPVNTRVKLVDPVERSDFAAIVCLEDGAVLRLVDERPDNAMHLESALFG